MSHPSTDADIERIARGLIDRTLPKANLEGLQLIEPLGCRSPLLGNAVHFVSRSPIAGASLPHFAHGAVIRRILTHLTTRASPARGPPQPDLLSA